ncbi:MAG TPA: hypothetical protein VG371_00605 [Solirubrobacteraceae bacterium]|nr:hypothetical protein [Solirubrobacteraceae bacterium]
MRDETEAATLHLLPTLWFRNTWAWGDDVARPKIEIAADIDGLAAARAHHAGLGEWLLRADPPAELLFCDNETNNQRLFGAPNASAHPKDAINDYLVGGVRDAVSPDRTGTKVAAHHVLDRAPGESRSIRLRLTGAGGEAKLRGGALGVPFDRVMSARRTEADRFYELVVPETLTADEALVMRQALAGMLWSKQYHEYDVHRWLREHAASPWEADRPAGVRNLPWFHMIAGDIISMPDKWV